MSTQKAIVFQGPGVAELVNDRPIPQVRGDLILVKTAAVALNPTDWKAVERNLKNPGPLLGCDYAGTVVEVGPNVTKLFKKGDRIAGATHGGSSVQHEYGAFAPYILVKGDLQFKIPDNVTFEEAATFGVGFLSCGLGLYQELGLAFPNAPLSSPAPILIYGGSTATGTLGIQLAKLSGYTVITTCSPRNNDLVKGRGADVVFDYSDPDCGKKIREYTGDKLTIAWDTISTLESASICCDALTSGAGAKYSNLGPVELPRKDVANSYILGYTALGEPIEFAGYPIPASKENFDFMVNFINVVGGLLADGKIQGHPRTEDKGIEKIVGGLKVLKDGVSAKKLVFTIGED